MGTELNTIFSRLPGAVVLHRQGKIHFANPAATQLLGVSAEELAGRGFRDVLMTEEREGSTEVRLSQKEGKAVWLQCSTSLLEGGTGSSSFVSVLQDITEKKVLESKLLETQARMFAASKMSALGEMAGGIAHEINNPLTVIRVYMGVLREGIQKAILTKEQLLENVEKVDATVVRVSGIIHSMMGFARNAEQDPFQIVPVRTLLEDTLRLCEPRIRKDFLEIRFDPVDESLVVQCRRVLISQVVLNLLNNAADAVAGRPVRWVRIAVQDLGEQVEVAIEDSGPGVPEELREKIMQPFFTTKPLGKGTGLGLSVSKKLIESHQGTIFLDTQSPVTRFALRFPKRQFEQ